MKSTHALTKVTTLNDDDVIRIALDPENAAVAETDRGVNASVIKYKTGDVRLYGDVGSASLQLAIDAVGSAGTVFVAAGTYEKVDITDSNRTFVVEQGAVFTVPNNDITASSSSGTPALTVTGNNLRFRGELYLDGNKANQTTSGFAASERSATLKIVGDNAKFDDVEIHDAFWDALTIDGGPDSGDEALNTRINRLFVKDPENRSATLWSCDGFEINEFVVDCETIGNGDHRIRPGNDSIDSAECKDGWIGRIRTPNNTVVVESGTNGLSFGHVRAMSWKCEDCNDIAVESLDLRNVDDGSSVSFGVINATKVQIGSVSVKDHAGSTAVAGAIEQATSIDVQIGRYYCDGALGGAHGLRVRDATRLYIGTAICNNNTGKGVFVDESVSFTQSDIYFGSIHATGNTGTDVEFQTGIERSGFGYLARESGGTYAGIAADCWSYPFGITACGKIAVDGGDGSTTITNDFNVTSAVEDVLGQYTVTFTTTVADLVVTAQGEDTEQIDITSAGGSAMTFVTRNQSGTLIRPTSFFFIVMRVEQDNL